MIIDRIKDIGTNSYMSIHKKLKRAYGKATKCEQEGCTNEKAKRYEWALKKGRSYSKNIEDYIQFCPSCHRKYDFTEEMRDNLSKSNRGENSHKTNLKDKDVLKIRELLSSGMQNKDVAKMYSVNSPVISNIRTGKTWAYLLPKI